MRARALTYKEGEDEGTEEDRRDRGIARNHVGRNRNGCERGSAADPAIPAVKYESLKPLRLTCGALGLVVAFTACLGQAEPAPDALTRYLDDLVADRLDQAYDRTQLAEIDAFSRGGAVSRQHFESFYAADPVRSYEVLEVVRLDRRAPDQLAEQGTPEWEVLVRLEHSSGPVESSFGVVGEVLAQITVVPVALDLVIPARGVQDVSVDGVGVDVTGSAVGDEGDRWRIVVLAGRHTIEVDGLSVRFDAQPLRVIEGSARAEGDPAGAGPQALRIIG